MKSQMSKSSTLSSISPGSAVRVTGDPAEEVELVETGVAEWVSQPFVREHYGVRPELLRDLLVSGNAMADTIEAGDRLRVVLWDCCSPNNGMVVSCGALCP